MRAQRLLPWGIPLLGLGVAFAVGLAPGGGAPLLILDPRLDAWASLDKFLHLLAGAGLAGGTVWAMASRPRARLAVGVVAASVALGALEVLQLGVPGRTASVVDGMANVAGACIGGLVGELAYGRLARRMPLPAVASAADLATE